MHEVNRSPKQISPEEEQRLDIEAMMAEFRTSQTSETDLPSDYVLPAFPLSQEIFAEAWASASDYLTGKNDHPNLSLNLRFRSRIQNDRLVVDIHYSDIPKFAQLLWAYRAAYKGTVIDWVDGNLKPRRAEPDEMLDGAAILQTEGIVIPEKTYFERFNFQT